MDERGTTIVNGKIVEVSEPGEICVGLWKEEGFGWQIYYNFRRDAQELHEEIYSHVMMLRKKPPERIVIVRFKMPPEAQRK